MNEVLNIEYIRENIVSDSLYNDFIVMESDFLMNREMNKLLYEMEQS
jgi:hypothetical protein